MSVLLPQRIGHVRQPPGVAAPSVREQPQYVQSLLHPEQMGSTAVGLPVKKGQTRQSQPRAGTRTLGAARGAAVISPVSYTHLPGVELGPALR